ncbi:MAG: hypothetical protein V3U86_08180 [Acidobacteriota bacterium]
MGGRPKRPPRYAYVSPGGDHRGCSHIFLQLETLDHCEPPICLIELNLGCLQRGPTMASQLPRLISHGGSLRFCIGPELSGRRCERRHQALITAPRTNDGDQSAMACGHH